MVVGERKETVAPLRGGLGFGVAARTDLCGREELRRVRQAVRLREHNYKRSCWVGLVAKRLRTSFVYNPDALSGRAGFISGRKLKPEPGPKIVSGRKLRPEPGPARVFLGRAAHAQVYIQYIASYLLAGHLYLPTVRGHALLIN